MVKLSELLEKLYNNSYLTDEEYNTYVLLVSSLKQKENINETQTNRRI